MNLYFIMRYFQITYDIASINKLIMLIYKKASTCHVLLLTCDSILFIPVFIYFIFLLFEDNQAPYVKVRYRTAGIIVGTILAVGLMVVLISMFIRKRYASLVLFNCHRVNMYRRIPLYTWVK